MARRRTNRYKQTTRSTSRDTKKRCQMNGAEKQTKRSEIENGTKGKEGTETGTKMTNTTASDTTAGEEAEHGGKGKEVGAAEEENQENLATRYAPTFTAHIDGGKKKKRNTKTKHKGDGQKEKMRRTLQKKKKRA